MEVSNDDDITQWHSFNTWFSNACIRLFLIRKAFDKLCCRLFFCISSRKSVEETSNVLVASKFVLVVYQISILIEALLNYISSYLKEKMFEVLKEGFQELLLQTRIRQTSIGIRT